MAASPNIDELLERLEQGDTDASAALIDLVYPELRALAGSYFRGKQDNATLQPTELVHEAFLKLARASGQGYRGREHFFAVAATAMRQILVSRARKRHAAKRGGGQAHITLTNVALPGSQATIDALELDAVLCQLQQLSPRQARIVEYRFFGGMTAEEIAKVLNVSPSTVEKEWRRARAWLSAQLAPKG